MNTHTIGILGGMGPRATVYFESRLLAKLSGSDQTLPRIVCVNDGSIPDRTAYLQGIGEDPLPALLRCALDLLALRPSVVCIPCNTAHADNVLGRLLALLPLPIIDMPAAALRQLAGHGQVLVLGTEGTKLSGVYDSRAEGIRVTYPNSQTQGQINRLIAETKQAGFSPENRDALQTIVQESTTPVILACTELSMLNRDLHATGIVIDALEALADECVRQVTKRYNTTKRKDLEYDAR